VKNCMNMGHFNSLNFNIQLPIKKQLACLTAAFIIGLMQYLIFFSIMKTFWTGLCMKNYKHGFQRDYTKIKKIYVQVTRVYSPTWVFPLIYYVVYCSVYIITWLLYLTLCRNFLYAKHYLILGTSLSHKYFCFMSTDIIRYDLVGWS
jgi:hypothetical protein